MTKAIIRYLFVLFVAFLCIPVDAQNLKWRDMYQVKKKDTLFGIAKNFGLTLEELINANPEMKVAGYELKKGLRMPPRNPRIRCLLLSCNRKVQPAPLNKGNRPKPLKLVSFCHYTTWMATESG